MQRKPIPLGASTEMTLALCPVRIDRQTGELVLDLGPERPLVRDGSKQVIEDYMDWLDAGKPEEAMP